MELDARLHHITHNSFYLLTTISMLSEEILYALWADRATTGAGFICRDGERVVVISSGTRNDGAGPDYQGAVLAIDGELRAGSVEMHRSEEEWFEHRHDRDGAYDDVILHVVERFAGRGPAIATVAAATLELLDPGDSALSVEWEQAGPDPHLLAELAWGRLLRRTTEIIRTEADRPIDDRVRRAFLRRLFDSLGYAANREPMRGIAELLLRCEPELAAGSFGSIAARVFSASGLDRERFESVGRGFMPNSRLADIVNNSDLPAGRFDWRYDTRPANAPERRLWGGVKLLFDLYHNNLAGRLLDMVASGLTAVDIARHLKVRLGVGTMVGIDRAREIVVNGLAPVALAAGIMRSERSLIERACTLYREAPSLGSNRIVRSVEKRYMGGEALDGAFWQQGAIELYQRYLLPDRSRISFVAER